MAIRRYRPPRTYAESHSFQQDFDALAPKYPDLAEIVGALLWGIGENPLDFDFVPGHRSEDMRMAKTCPLLIESGETVIVRIFFMVPESGPIEIEYLDMEPVDPAEMGS
jgi:hypothetical protein